MFADALALILQFEGGYVNDPDDPGGATNKGITQKTYNLFRVHDGKPIQPVLHIEPDEVRRIYQRNYWIECGADRLPDKLALVVFDTAVNMGVKYARLYVIASGYPKSATEPTACKTVLKLREARYDHLCVVNPTLKKFRHGWQVRLLKLAHHVGVTL
ncbi:MAG: hypothetical protein H0U85_03505 [Gemmatimonadales bacterium]|nr:hypothetical protein [Gemmatimonadales bacterium]